MLTLTLRPTVIAGDKLPNDYCVIHDGRAVGRIHQAHGLNGSTIWNRNINPPLPIPLCCNGSADSFETAKDLFKAAWERFYASLTPEDVESLAPHRGPRQGERFMAEMSWSRRFGPPIELQDKQDAADAERGSQTCAGAAAEGAGRAAMAVR